MAHLNFLSKVRFADIFSGDLPVPGGKLKDAWSKFYAFESWEDDVMPLFCESLDLLFNAGVCPQDIRCDTFTPPSSKGGWTKAQLVGQVLLICACSIGDLKSVKILGENAWEAKLNMDLGSGRTTGLDWKRFPSPLSCAVMNGHFDVVEYLIGFEEVVVANPNIVDPPVRHIGSGVVRDVLYAAIAHGNTRIASLLLKHSTCCVTLSHFQVAMNVKNAPIFKILMDSERGRAMFLSNTLKIVRYCIQVEFRDDGVMWPSSSTYDEGTQRHNPLDRSWGLRHHQLRATSLNGRFLNSEKWVKESGAGELLRLCAPHLSFAHAEISGDDLWKRVDMNYVTYKDKDKGISKHSAIVSAYIDSLSESCLHVEMERAKSISAELYRRARQDMVAKAWLRKRNFADLVRVFVHGGMPPSTAAQLAQRTLPPLLCKHIRGNTEPVDRRAVPRPEQICTMKLPELKSLGKALQVKTSGVRHKQDLLDAVLRRTTAFFPYKRRRLQCT